MTTSDASATATVLAIGAHPDDIDISAGGTIAKWIGEGATVQYCVVTQGEAGSSDTQISAATIPSLRRGEQDAAAASLGVGQVHYLGFPDGKLLPSLELRVAVAKLIRSVRPNRILTHAPVVNLNSVRYSHPDHLVVGQAVLAAVFPDARNPYAFSDTDLRELPPHSVDAIWMMGVPTPSTYVDISSHIEEKIQAVKCHRSQTGDLGDVRDFLVSWAEELAADAGMGTGGLAEAFFVMDTR